MCVYVGGSEARLAQSVERKTLNLVVVGSSPTVGTSFLSPICCFYFVTHPHARLSSDAHCEGHIQPPRSFCAHDNNKHNSERQVKSAPGYLVVTSKTRMDSLFIAPGNRRTARSDDGMTE